MIRWKGERIVMKISQIDRNFAIESKLQIDGIQFYDIECEPFCIYGVFKENGKYRRMPEECARNVSQGVYALHTCTSGGRVRFVTDSPYVAINAKMGSISRMSHISLNGSAGFDMYVRENGKEIYRGTFNTPYDITDGYESCIDFYDEPQKKMREIS